MTDGQSITLRRRLWLAGLVVLAATLAGFWLLPAPRFVREFVVLAGVAAYGVATLLVVFSRCPRCGHLFHDVRGFANPFSRRCAGCGVRIESMGRRSDEADGPDRRR